MNKKKWLFSLITCIFLMGGILKVDAATLTSSDIESDKDYIFYWTQNNGEYDSGYLKNFTIIDDEVEKIAYCIEPYVAETTEPDGYMEVSWENIGLSDEIKQEILLTAYYGYQYPGHQTQRYRAATQALLWKAILNSKYGSDEVSYDVSYAVKYYDETEQKYVKEDYDVETEREIISNLVSHHNDKPSFDGVTYLVTIGETITIDDKNSVLENYEVYETNGALVSIKGNTLDVTSTSLDEVEIVFVRKQVYTDTYFVYYAEEHQNMITGGNIDPVYFSIKLKGTQKEEISEEPEVMQVVSIPNTGLNNTNFSVMSMGISGILGLGLICYAFKHRKKIS